LSIKEIKKTIFLSEQAAVITPNNISKTGICDETTQHSACEMGIGLRRISYFRVLNALMRNHKNGVE
jgi:hypothetical protein